MKRFKKAAALLLVVLTVLSLSSCSKVGKWIAKTDEAEVPIGLYISSLSNYYAYATYMVEDKEKSPIGQMVEITDEETEEKEKRDAVEWIQEMAMENCIAILNLMHRCNEVGITLNEEEKASVDAATQTKWNEQGESYEKNGIAMSSVRLIFEYQALTLKYFEYLYGAEGTKEAISDEAAKEYYVDNYSYIDYFRVYLGNYKENSDDYEDRVEFADDLSQKIHTGKLTLEDALKEYNAEFKENRTITTERKETKVDYKEDFYKKFSALKAEGCTSFIYDNYLYVLVKNDVEKDTEYMENNLADVRMQMKSEEFSNFLMEQVDELEYTVNEEAKKKYSPKWMEKQMEAE